MANFNASKVTGDQLSADEWNQTASINNVVISSGQTPSTGDLTQLGKAMANYAAISTYYTDSGSADAYVLSSVGSLEAPHVYANGMIIRFRAGNANTGASTVNVDGLGVKNLKKEDGSTDLVAGDISDQRDSYFRYNGTSFVAISITNNPTVQKFTSGSGTYTTPAGVKYIEVFAVGAGGGGAGSATVVAVDAGDGSNGGNTTFGTSLIVANAGTGGVANGGSTGGVGGTASLGSGPIGIAVQGGRGASGGVNVNSSVFNVGGNGAASFFGGEGGTTAGGAGQPATTNSGSGGGGASAPNTGRAGGGGGAGGFVRAIINSPVATYAYSVGAAGAAGAAGTGGSVGGAGAAGQIIVFEYYH